LIRTRNGCSLKGSNKLIIGQQYLVKLLLISTTRLALQSQKEDIVQDKKNVNADIGI